MTKLFTGKLIIGASALFLCTPSFAEVTSFAGDAAAVGPEMSKQTRGTPASARGSGTRLEPKNPSLPPMMIEPTQIADAGKVDAPIMEHPEMDAGATEVGARSGAGGGSGMTAEQMRSNSAWATSGGLEGYSGVGGPLEELRPYPRCRSRGDDRCRQGN